MQTAVQKKLEEQGVMITRTLLFQQDPDTMDEVECLSAYAALKIISEDLMKARVDQLRERMATLVLEKGEKKTLKTTSLELLDGVVQVQMRKQRAKLDEDALSSILEKKKIPAAKVRDLSIPFDSIKDGLGNIEAVLKALSPFTEEAAIPTKKAGKAQLAETIGNVVEFLANFRRTCENEAIGSVNEERVGALMALGLVTQEEYARIFRRGPDAPVVVLQTKPPHLVSLLTQGGSFGQLGAGSSSSAGKAPR